MVVCALASFVVTLLPTYMSYIRFHSLLAVGKQLLVDSSHEAFDGKGKRGNGVESGPLAHIHHHKHRKALEFIEDVTANADQVQRRVLAEILAQNAPAEYLHRHGLPGRTAPDPDAFKRLIPVVTYEDIRPDILRIAHGDTSPILSGRPISEFLTRFAARSHMYPLGK
ncbi:hypothetical protein BHM03_00031348 [Ensete ventricosum]|nr:hypothetical protein BHM03_00031348 [Ensete ventricosum]